MNRLTMAVAVLLLAAPAVSRAAGFYLYEIGTPSVGLASAGYTTRAGDAETLFTNPAGMALLEKHEFLAGAQLLYGNVTFSPGPGTTTSGGNGGNAVGFLPGGSLFFVADVAPRFRVGLGVAQYFGSALQYDPGWVGRYYGQKALLLGVSFLPTASYRITDWLSVGGGLNLMWGIKRATMAVNNVLPSLADGQVETNADTFGVGVNLGILVEPVKGTRVGFTWLSQVHLPFSSTPAWSGLGPGIELALRQAGLLDATVGLGMTLPNRLMLGVRQEIGPEWAVMADLGWESWSQFGAVEVSVNTANPISLTTSIPYKDTWHVAAGAQWRAIPAWTFSGGFAFDSSIMDDAVRTVFTPVGAAWRFSLGAQWQVSDAVQLGLADTFIVGGNLPLSQSRGPLAGTLEGQYSGTVMNMLAFNVRWLI
jgi:long-chain fatty acid transport protein